MHLTWLPLFSASLALAAALVGCCRFAVPPAEAPDVAPPPDRLPVVYALIWRAHATDDAFDAREFQARIPRLMAWLRSLHERGALVACGGGGLEDRSGGLTLVRAASPEEALDLARGNPMNEIGTTELLVWDVYFADLAVPRPFR